MSAYTPMKRMNFPQYPYTSPAWKVTFLCPVIHAEFVARPEALAPNLGVPTASDLWVEITFLRPVFSSTAGSDTKARVETEVITKAAFDALPWAEHRIEIPRVHKVKRVTT